MLDMGFIRPCAAFTRSCRKSAKRFSATFSRILKSSPGSFASAQKIQVTPANTTVSRIDQTVYPVDKARKTELLKHLVASEQWGQVLVFSRTKYGADKLSRNLSKAGIASDSIHGDKKQGARTRSLKQFKDGRLQVLVATDIAARGIDIQQLPRVVNFDLPHVAEDYVHRSATGRAGEAGIALSLVSADEVAQLEKIEKLIRNRCLGRKLRVRARASIAHQRGQIHGQTSAKASQTGARKQRDGQGKKRQGGPSAKRQGQPANRGRKRKPARANA